MGTPVSVTAKLRTTLLALPNELLLMILDRIPALHLASFIVAFAPHLVRHALIPPIPAPELRAMCAFVDLGMLPASSAGQPSDRRIQLPPDGDRFSALPAELWFQVGEYLRLDDRVAFAVAVWRNMAHRWRWADAERKARADASLTGR